MFGQLKIWLGTLLLLTGSLTRTAQFVQCSSEKNCRFSDSLQKYTDFNWKFEKQ